MLIFRPENNQIRLYFNNTPDFGKVVDELKALKCTYLPDSKCWYIAPPKFYDVIDKLSSFDEMSIQDENEIKGILKGKLELIKSRERIIFNQDLLKFPPIKGKPPYENFQKVDIIRGLMQNRFFYNWECGLGKSYATVGLMEHLNFLNKAKKFLLITTPSGLYNLKHEILKFSKNFKSEDIEIGNAKSREPFNTKAKIIISTYGSMRLISDHYYFKKEKRKSKDYRKTRIPLENWLDGDTGCLFLDESHKIGNAKSRQTKVFMQIKHFFEYRYLFSATPADVIEKYYPQLNMLDSNLVSSCDYHAWLEDMAVLGNKWSVYAINYFKPEKVKALMDRLNKDYMKKRESDTHLDLPENYMRKRYVELSDKHKKLYESFIVHTLGEIQKKFGRLEAKRVKNSFAYMMSSLDAPELLIDNPRVPLDIQDLAKKFKLIDNNKIEVLDDLVKEHTQDNKEDTIVWVSHPSQAYLLAERYKKYNPLVLVGNTEGSTKGMTKDQIKQEIVDTFKSSKKHKMLIANISVLNTSVTVTNATCQIYFQRSFNFIEYAQSQKRIYRYGQEKDVTTYVLIFDNTLDVYKDEALDNKDTINSKLLDKDFLSKEEWNSIFKMANRI